MAKDLTNVEISAEQEAKIKSKTPDKLPLNPTSQGYSGAEVRRFLGKSLIDDDGSLFYKAHHLSKLKYKCHNHSLYRIQNNQFVVDLAPQ